MENVNIKESFKKEHKHEILIFLGDKHVMLAVYSYVIFRFKAFKLKKFPLVRHEALTI